MSGSFLDQVRDEQHLTTVALVISRLAEMDCLTAEAAGIEARTLASAVIDNGTGSTSKVNMVRSVAGATASLAAKAGKVLGEAACKAGQGGVDLVQSAMKKAVVLEGPACPKCGAGTRLRTASKTGRVFFACSDYADTGCTGTLDIVEAK